jgi:predicted DNA-binding ribbon-helix-helix protein
MTKRSLTIQGHRTSIALEPVFWEALRRASAARSISMAALVADIDTARGTGLSSAIRVWLMEQALAGQLVIGHSADHVEHKPGSDP